MISIQFQNMVALIIIVWIMLFWFALRFLQSTQGMAIDLWLKDAHTTIRSRSTIKYIEKKTGRKYKAEKGFIIRDFVLNKWKWVVTYSVIENVKFNENGDISGHTNIESDVPVNIVGWKGMLVKVHVLALASIKREGFSNYIVPYVLFLLVLILYSFGALY